VNGQGTGNAERPEIRSPWLRCLHSGLRPESDLQVFGSVPEALPVIADITRGQLADACIITTGNAEGGYVGEALEYRLEDINEGYQDMLEGRNIRGLVRF
jgi:hypothetical protein